MKQHDARQLERLLKLAQLQSGALRSELRPDIQRDLKLQKDVRALQASRLNARGPAALDAKIAQTGDIYDVWCIAQLGAIQIQRAALQAKIAPAQEDLARAEARRMVIEKLVQDGRKNRLKR